MTAAFTSRRTGETIRMPYIEVYDVADGRITKIGRVLKGTASIVVSLSFGVDDMLDGRAIGRKTRNGKSSRAGFTRRLRAPSALAGLYLRLDECRRP